LLGIVLLLFGLLQWRTGEFLRPENLRNVLTDAALLGFCAVGATVVILAGGLDISLGALMALSAGIAGRLWEQGYPLPVVAAVALAVGAGGSLLNAGLSLLGRVHPIVVTLGTMSVYRGLTLWWLQQDVQIAGTARDWIFAGAFGLPVIVWAGIGLLFLSWGALNATVPGREVYALGSNPAAAHRVSIERWRVIGFPASPRGEQWALFRGHELAERAATEMGISLKSDPAHLWKNLSILCLRYCRLA